MITNTTKLVFNAGGIIKVIEADNNMKIVQFSVIPDMYNDMIWLTIKELKNFHKELGEYIKVIE